MNIYRNKKRITAAGLLLLLLLSLLSPFAGAEETEPVRFETVRNTKQGDYTVTTLHGLTPYVFMPTGAGTENSGDIMNAWQLLERYGEENRILCACNAGIFYASEERRWYGYHYKEADGPVICNGVVLKSAESVDHTECTLLVIDETGAVGYAPYDTDADALAAGTGIWYDIYGNAVTGRRIISAVTGFVPIVINGKNVYSRSDTALHGYDNYVGHYTRTATREIFGVKANGDFVLLNDKEGWTLNDAAKAAIREGCVFAYNLDGGGSAQTVTAEETEEGYTITSRAGRGIEARTVPTFLVFTADNCMPVSADPVSWTVTAEDCPAVWEESAVAECLTVTVQYLNADGNISERKLITAALREEGPIEHAVLGGSTSLSGCTVVKKGESGSGVFVYKKTDKDTEGCIEANRNTRLDGCYYDYSAGYTIELTETEALLRYETGDTVLSAAVSYEELQKAGE